MLFCRRNQQMKNSKSLNRLGLACALAVASLLCATSARAASSTIHTYENPDVPTVFNLDFPDLAISSTSNVIATRFTMEIDPDAGTARFTAYDQYIEPLSLPLGISTGLIHVSITSSEGTYDAVTKTFVTNDQYEISFANDLSFFGFTSPVVIPSTSHGTFKNSTARGQNVEMAWTGDGELANSDNPDEPFKYTYTCRSSTIIDLPENIPALPNLSAFQACGAGACGATGLGAMLLMFVGMGFMRVRPRRCRRAA